MAATHHSQLNDAIFFPFSRFFSMGEAGRGVFQPASNQRGSTRVHILQVGPRKRTRFSRTYLLSGRHNSLEYGRLQNAAFRPASSSSEYGRLLQRSAYSAEWRLSQGKNTAFYLA